LGRINRAAAEAIRSAFGRICDEDYPGPHDVSDDQSVRFSRCLRHNLEFRDPAGVIRGRGSPN